MVVARFWLVVVFAAVPLGVSCFLSCRVGGILDGPLKRWRAGTLFWTRHSATSGLRVIRARLVFWRSGASGKGAKAVVTKS